MGMASEEAIRDFEVLMEQIDEPLKETFQFREEKSRRMEENSGTRELGWSDRLGMVETIFEEEEESQDSVSDYSSPSSPDLFSSIESWSRVTGKRPDVTIHAQGESFWLQVAASFF